MSIPGIHGIPGVGRGFAPLDERTDPPSARARDPAAEVDVVTRQPLPLRFPWLSRLAQQLGPAARQRPAFSSAPLLGERLDRSA